MSLVISKSWSDGEVLFADDLNGVHEGIAAKFTEGVGGIADADISSNAAIRGSKISSTPGARITAAQMEDGTVTNAKLATGVALQNLGAASITHDKLKILSLTVAVSSLAAGGSLHLDTTLDYPAAIPICVNRDAAFVAGSCRYTLNLLAIPGDWYIDVQNDSGLSMNSHNVRIWYLSLT